MQGLQGRAQTELRQQGIQDLHAAMVVVGCLVDYKSKDKGAIVET